MSWIPVGALAALGDLAAASLIRNSTSETRGALDEYTADMVADAVAGAPAVAAAAAAAAGSAVDDIMAAAMFHRRDLGTGEDMNAVRQPGVYPARTNTVAASLVNAPESVSGTYVVFGAETGLKAQVFISNLGGMSSRALQSSNSQWTEWENQSRRARPLPATVTDLATFRQLGLWRVSLAQAGTLANRPPIPAASATVEITSHNNSQTGSMRKWTDAEGNGEWLQTNSLTGWTAWYRPSAPGGAGDGLPINALALGGRPMRVQMFEDAYPLVSTGDKGAVVFRYDHGLTNFAGTLKALHDTHDIPAYIAMNSRLWDTPANSGATTAQAAAWENVEWGNHTADHTDKTGIEDIHDAIVGGRIELEQQLGRTIHGFTVPGVTGYDKFDGFGTGGVDGYSSSYAGSLVLAHHAVADGTIGPTHRPLDGQLRIGGRHHVWEASEFAAIKTQIDLAVTNKTALTLMAHPASLGTGPFTAALADQVIGYVREQINAGNLADLTYYQSHRATTRSL